MPMLMHRKALSQKGLSQVVKGILSVKSLCCQQAAQAYHKTQLFEKAAIWIKANPDLVSINGLLADSSGSIFGLLWQHKNGRLLN